MNKTGLENIREFADRNKGRLIYLRREEEALEEIISLLSKEQAQLTMDKVCPWHNGEEVVCVNGSLREDLKHKAPAVDCGGLVDSEMVDIIQEAIKYPCNGSALIAAKEICSRFTISRHPLTPEAQKPPAADCEGLMEAIKKFAKRYGGIPERELNEILSRYPSTPEAQKPSVDGLVDELKTWAIECGLKDEPEIEDMNQAYFDFNEILSRHAGKEEK